MPKKDKNFNKNTYVIAGTIFLIIFSIFVTGLVFKEFFNISVSKNRSKISRDISQNDDEKTTKAQDINDTKQSNEVNTEDDIKVDDEDTPSPKTSPQAKGIKTSDKITLNFQSKGGYQVQLTGLNNSESFNLFDYKIKEASYKNAKDLQDNVYLDYESGSWGDYLFYLSSNDQYYLFFPSSSATFRLISKDELQKEFEGEEKTINEDGSITEKECTLKKGYFLKSDCYLLKCEHTYSYENKQNPDLSYTSTSSNTSWLYELGDNNFLMYRILTSPAGSEIDSRMGHEMDGVEEIKIL